MSEISKNIVSLIVSKEFHKAKILIHEAMNNKLGLLLEEKLLEYGPTLHEGGEYQTIESHERLLQKLANRENGIEDEKPSIHTDPELDGPQPFRFGNDFSKLQKPIIPIIPVTDEQRDFFDKQISDFDDRELSLAQRDAKRSHEINPAKNDGKVVVPAWGVETQVLDEPEDKISSSLKNIQDRAFAAGELGAVGALIPRTRTIGGKLFKLGWQVEQGAAAVDNIKNDPAWKDDTDTAIANSTAEIAKRVAMGSVFSLGLPLTGAVAGGAALAWPLAKATDAITGAKKGEGLADEIYDSKTGVQWDTYEPKNWVASAKAMYNQLVNNPYAGVHKDTVKPPVAAGTVRNGSGQIMHQ